MWPWQWDWGWHGGNPPMRGWGSVIVLGGLFIYFGILLWYKRRS